MVILESSKQVEEYSQLSQNAINNAINYLCTGQLSKCKDLEDFINKFTNQLNILQFNGYELNDKFKIKFFFKALGEYRTSVETHCLNNNLNFAQSLSYKSMIKSYQKLSSSKVSVSWRLSVYLCELLLQRSSNGVLHVSSVDQMN